LLFKSSFYVLNKFSSDTKFFGGKLGYIGLLHTWGQRLNYHPHIHYMVLAGGIKDGSFKKLPYQKKFIFPVKALSKVMMGKFIETLRVNYYKGDLKFPGKLEAIENEQDFNNFLYLLSKKSWVVHSKPPIPNTERTLEYISRYTHKVAISNYRIKKYNSGKVSFEYKDYREKDKLGLPKKKLMTFSDMEFIRRFLLHILPNGFRKIRYGGIFSSNNKADAIRIIKESIGVQLKRISEKLKSALNLLEDKLLCVCPKCNSRVLINEYG
ncbi:MAG: IS91 family transposase, partial [Ignavibacteriae bacterium]|nr:IS91 family transposase [Ignavibacteriota bacterium]